MTTTFLLVASCSGGSPTSDGGSTPGGPATRTVLEELGAPITALALSPAAQQVAVGRSGALDVRDMLGHAVATFAVQAGNISALAFSPDGARLVSGGQGNALTVWNVSTGAQVHALTNTTFPVRALAVAPLGQLAAATGDNFIKTFDSATGTAGASWLLQAAALAYLSDSTLVTAGADGAIKQVDPGSGRLFVQAQAHAGGVAGLWVDTAARQIVTIGPDGKVRLGDNQGDELQSWTAPATPKSMHADARRIVAGLVDGTVLVVGREGGEAITFSTGETSVNAVALAGSTLVVGTEGGELSYWTLR